jgi:hypothetical protein
MSASPPKKNGHSAARLSQPLFAVEGLFRTEYRAAFSESLPTTAMRMERV